MLSKDARESDTLSRIMKMEKVGRNAPCPCGSGKKYKQCHAGQDAQQSRSGKWIAVVLGGVLLLGALGFLNALSNRNPEDATPRGVWSEEHQHYH